MLDGVIRANTTGGIAVTSGHGWRHRQLWEVSDLVALLEGAEFQKIGIAERGWI
jgi:hypothetical protein